MSKSNDLTPLEIVEMFVTVFCFLKDSSKDSQTLLEDFRTCQGYTFLTEFVLRYNITLRYHHVKCIDHCHTKLTHVLFVPMIRLEKEATSNPGSLEDGERKKEESSTTTEASEAMRNLVLLVASLSFLGHTELPSSTVMDEDSDVFQYWNVS